MPKVRTQRRSTSQKAGLVFPVSRFHSMLKQESKAKVTKGAAVYLAATLEYLIAEWVEVSGGITHQSKKKTIMPHHMKLATENDEEMDRLLRNCQFHTGPKSSLATEEALKKTSTTIKTAKSVSSSTKMKPVKVVKVVKKVKKLPSTKPTSSNPTFTLSTPSSPVSFNSTPTPKTFTPSSKSPKKSPSRVTATRSGYLWQYQHDGWKDYDARASEIVESNFETFFKEGDQGPVKVGGVKSGEWEYEVDFVKMQQTNLQHANHTVRAIRRITVGTEGSGEVVE
eukprot:TRINITY_DN1316_c0_g1_i2.p1 TRINITY_DN1316_c0_g1~~TRINITY_DN1316_c0_g1_i2.p1  ORF type:complete len:330 (-),score=97.75 TRINITY_DN1316_c0_g1_i2:178-1023(-)